VFEHGLNTPETTASQDGRLLAFRGREGSVHGWIRDRHGPARGIARGSASEREDGGKDCESSNNESQHVSCPFEVVGHLLSVQYDFSMTKADRQPLAGVRDKERLPH
jgi:hypothetical protein